MELFPSQKEHWERQLKYARKAVEVAEFMLGITSVKEVIEDEDNQRNQTDGETPPR